MIFGPPATSAVTKSSIRVYSPSRHRKTRTRPLSARGTSTENPAKIDPSGCGFSPNEVIP